MTSNLVVLDTSIFIDHLRTGCHQKRIDSLSGLLRTSSVVLSELLRGATKPAEQSFLKELAKNHPLLTPSESNWSESGHILAKMRANEGFSPQKLRDLHFDVLIALTALTYGARLITSNRADFELIRRYRSFSLEVW
jgi:predicted nucleic acid-binding protein